MNKKTYSYDEIKDDVLKYFDNDELSADVWIKKYSLKDQNGNILEKSPVGTHRRMAKEFARIENNYLQSSNFDIKNLSEYGKNRKNLTEDKIFDYFDNFKYIVPQGSVMASLGNEYNFSSLSNCVVIPPVYDSYGGIMFSDQQLAQLFKRRCGVGVDISTLRPENSLTNNSAGTSTGAVSFMERFSNTTREVAQCLHGDTLILTESGLKNIKDIIIGEKVWTKEGWIKVVNVLKNKKPLKIIKSKFGNELICSEDHIVHTITGEKSIKELNIGDSITSIIGNGWNGNEKKLINIPYERIGINQSNRLNDKIKLPIELNEKLAYFLGYSYGDGYISKEQDLLSLSISNYDHFNILPKLVDIIKDEFDYIASVEDKKKYGKYIVIKIHSKVLINFLQKNNILKQKSNDIEFPKILLGADKEILFSFISGYFDADGCNQKSKKVYKVASIQKDFLLTIQKILYSHGVISKIYKQERNNTNWKSIYYLSVNGNKSQIIFKDLLKNSIKMNYNRISKVRDFVRTVYKVNDFDTVSSRRSYIIDNNQYLSYTTSYKLKDELKHKLEPVLIQDYIKDIMNYNNGILEDVYDLTLEKEHLFFANGFYVHNSGRRGALMITMDIKHPDIEKFITIKEDLKKVTGANISIKISDEFMTAVKNDTNFTLKFPINSETPEITKNINAKELWNKIIIAARNSAEPGLIFWDRQHWYSTSSVYPEYENISTNPCAEIAMGGGDSCRLISLNMFGCVINPFTTESYFDFNRWYEISYEGQRLNDDLVDLELESIERILNKIRSDKEPEFIKDVELKTWQLLYDTGKKGRRTGLGFTAMGDTLAAINLKYDSNEAIKFIDIVMKKKCEAEFDSSIDMAIERGCFSGFDVEVEGTSHFIQMLKNELPLVYNRMMKFGRRNISISTVAPNGSISLLTKTTSGIEPIFMVEPYHRKKKIMGDEKYDIIDEMGDKWKFFDVYHPKIKMYLDINPGKTVNDSAYVSAANINWEKRIEMQQVIQKFVTHSISSTLNLSNDTTIDTVSNIYFRGWEMGLKGLTIYRDGSRVGVLTSKDKKEEKEATDSYVLDTNAPKRPKSLHCDIFRFVNNKEKWIGFVGLIKNHEENRPYEIFTGLLDSFQVPLYVESGEITKTKTDGVSRYDFVYKDKDGYPIIMTGLNRAFDREYWNYGKMISGVLRHRMPIKNVVELIDSLKFTEDNIVTWKAGVKRMLKKYVKAELMGEKCPNCDSDNYFHEAGCDICKDCGFSKKCS